MKWERWAFDGVGDKVNGYNESLMGKHSGQKQASVSKHPRKDHVPSSLSSYTAARFLNAAPLPHSKPHSH